LISLKNYSINGKLHREREGSNNAKIMKRWEKKKGCYFYTKLLEFECWQEKSFEGLYKWPMKHPLYLLKIKG
jgi:hypothetical protein